MIVSRSSICDIGREGDVHLEHCDVETDLHVDVAGSLAETLKSLELGCAQPSGESRVSIPSISRLVLSGQSFSCNVSSPRSQPLLTV